MKNYIVEFSEYQGYHTVKVYLKGFLGFKGALVGSASADRSQHALTKAFKGLFPKG